LVKQILANHAAPFNIKECGLNFYLTKLKILLLQLKFTTHTPLLVAR
jgi:hypothetical protein